MDGVKSDIYNINRIVEEDFSFNIPIYQRLYVWTDEQVKTLFEDLFTAYESQQELYYIGGVITVPNERGIHLFDLVDGQQRFTTLWLLANELGGAMLPFTYQGSDLRLQFSIRKNVEKYFKNIGTASNVINDTDNNFGDLVNISKARKQITSLLDEKVKEEERDDFIQFLMENVKLVISQVPEETDLNKLFETLNNRGAQLMQHEILKARLLKHITNPSIRQQYGKLWSVCSQMDEYLERVIAKEIGSAKNVAAVYDKYHGFSVKSVLNLFLKNQGDEKKDINLLKIIENPDKYQLVKDAKSEIGYHPESKDDEFEPVRSILTFPQLLLHALRIYLYRREYDDIERINEKELLQTFDKHFLKSDFINKKAVIKFIKLLFEVRECFDKYIIKWVEIDNEKEEHLIKKIYGQTYYLRREKIGLNGFALLQSILYHSQQNTTQYWLTPFLFWILDKPQYNEAYEWLRILDNTLLSSRREDISLPVRTWDSMKSYLPYAPSLSIFQEGKKIKKYGTHFPHYWFYKIEFVLWYYRKEFDKESEWKDYKMTARNSIEHISPQNPSHPRDKVCTEMLDAMGNLVLVTRSINSEYSNMPFQVKRSKFEDKKAKGSIDSLKSDVIYSKKEWNDALAMEHQFDIINLMEKYFNEHRIQ